MKKLTNKLRAKAARYLQRKQRTNTVGKTVSDSPRLIVLRSNKHISAQLITTTGQVVASASDAAIKKGTKSEKAFQVGESVAKMAVANNITQIHFDRSGYLYHGRVKQLAD
ncbi:MAG: 50S ribosomal protein L18 [Candidatus Peribacteria bacterium]|nr:MAG: 50S ribosomal protein L18 [Candidatus Peribacteria bacterium]